MTLLDRHVEFVTALRAGGLRISVAEGLDAVAALAAVDMADRETVRSGYAATVVKRHSDRPTFDAVFDLYFPPVLGALGSGPEGADPARDAPLPWEVDDPDRVRLREDLRRFLLSGDERQASRIARDAVGSLGTVRGRPGGRTSWSRITVLDRLAPQTLMHDLLHAFLDGPETGSKTGAETGGPDSGGTAESVARATIDSRLQQFTRLVESDVQRRLAAQTSPQAVARSAAGHGVDRIAFLSATKGELAQLRREIQPLARRLAARLAYTQRHGRRGQLDFRRTIRSSLSTGGVLIDTQHRPRRPVKTNLVVLCDVSSSVSSFAHFTLLLVYALRQQFTRVRAFAFVDELAEVTDFFTPGGDPLEAVARLQEEAKVTGFDGRTDYGRAIELFIERHADAIGTRTSLLVLGDARSNYGGLALPQLSRLVAASKHAYWLNPERRAAWDTGDSRAADFGAILPMVECRDLDQLGRFVQGLAT